MATARKLPSGAWRTRAYAGLNPDGSRFYLSCTANTKAESERAAASAILKWQKTHGQYSKTASYTLLEAGESFIANRQNTLAPDTIREYKRMLKSYMLSLHNRKVSDIRQEEMQAAVDLLAGSLSPKSVRNIYHFYLSIINSVVDDVNFKILLPQPKKVKYHDADDLDIQRLLYAAQGTSLEFAIAVSAFTGMRRSEIAGLRRSDIDEARGVLHVERAIVLGDDKKWHVKSTKNTESERDIDLSTFELDYILGHDSGKDTIIGVLPDTISKQFNKYKNQLGIKFRYHDLRSYNVSIMHLLGVPDKDIIKRTGHATPTIMNRVYNRTTQERVRSSSAAARDHFDSVIQTTMHHEMHHDD
ncbi:hypothetical protein AGMMS49992_25970 [Clostridia bacterium]|nr:hypothetical protein AGMMS49992_25970 [Clostridia bacterium]